MILRPCPRHAFLKTRGRIRQSSSAADYHVGLNATTEQQVSNPSTLDNDGWTPVSGSGFVEHTGPFWRKDGADGAVLFRMQVCAHHLNIQGRTHGGMLASLLDNALGWTVMNVEQGRPCVTVQLGIQYLAASKLGDMIEARSRIVRRTRTLVFAEGTLSVGDTDIAVASGVWKIIEAPTPSLAPTK